MNLYCWDESINDGSYGGNASAAIIAPSLEEARALLEREWEAYLEAHPHAIRTRSDGSTYGDETSDQDGAPSFYGVQSPRFYAAKIIRAFMHDPPPDRTIPLPANVPPQVVLLAKGYEG